MFSHLSRQSLKYRFSLLSIQNMNLVTIQQEWAEKLTSDIYKIKELRHSF